MDYYVGVDPDYFDKCADRVRVVLNHAGVCRILTGTQLHFDFDDQMQLRAGDFWCGFLSDGLAVHNSLEGYVEDVLKLDYTSRVMINQ